MRLPGTPSLVFLVYLLVFLPWAALRSARRFRAVVEGATARPLPSREAVWISSLVMLVFLFVLAWLTGRSFGFHIFAIPALGPGEVLATFLALAAYFLIRTALRAVRPEAQRRQLMVYRIAPRTAREWALWGLTVLAASVAEEAAYRGVAMSILWFSLGNPWAAAMICAAAFALAHAAQGWLSAAVIFVLALVMHGLVAYTDTLVLAMVVHSIYNFVTGTLIAREARRYETERSLP